MASTTADRIDTRDPVKLSPDNGPGYHNHRNQNLTDLAEVGAGKTESMGASECVLSGMYNICTLVLFVQNSFKLR